MLTAAPFIRTQAGGLSLLFRQTNIIWVVFIAGTAVIRHLEPPAELYDPPLAMATFRASLFGPANSPP